MTAAQRLLEQLAGAETVTVPGLPRPVRAALAAELVERKRLPVLIAEDAEDAEALHLDLCFLLGVDPERAADRGIVFFGADEKSPYEEYSPDARTVMERIHTLHRLAKERARLTAVVLSPGAIVRRHVPPTFFGRFSEWLVVGEEIDREQLVQKLIRAGYNRVSSVEDPGTFSVRGGIIDVFSPSVSRPIRIDLFGDEIESLHLFDPATHRNVHDLEDATLLPAREIAFCPETVAAARIDIESLAERGTAPTRRVNAVLDDLDSGIHFFGIEAFLPVFHPGGLVGADAYLPRGDDVVVLLGEQDKLIEHGDATWADARIAYERALANNRLALPPEAHLADVSEVLRSALSGRRQIRVPAVPIGGGPVLRLEAEPVTGLRQEILRATRVRGEEEEEDVLAPLTDRLRRWSADGLSSYLVCQTRGQAERLRQMLGGRDVSVRLETEPFSLERAPGHDPKIEARIVLGELSSGFVFRELGLAFVPEDEIFGARMKKRRQRRPAAGEFVSDLADLAAGDYVVHVDYGVGLYQGLTKLVVDGVAADYLHIEYRGAEKLYLPVSRLRLIQKYVGAQEGRAPPLDKLGSSAWATTKKKVKDHLLRMAAELLRLYASRQAVEGYAFPPPDESFAQFEAEFEHEPTPDQARAIEDVVRDLQRSAPMDRLICGDVGYGKTEVAMRATMMAVVAGRQTAVLVPTTVLAAQHFQTFSKRFENFGVNIALVSRFRSAEENRESLRRLAEGKIDIVIGTHRLLGKEVSFQRLGLLVIDEEHRFGVSHKERLKKYRSTVHVLAMSATPIPRTLHMGFMGVRDMSMIATPPEDRLAVKVEVHRFSEEILQESLIREIRRGGQAFVVHDRVSSIEPYARLIERLVPEARVAVGHGQMDQERLEKVMVDFMNKEFNVLLCTTIVESGIDIPNANTIVVNRADNLGLAQLYQLKGRVGRARARGYCYFLIPSGNLGPKAKKRIAVLQRFTELGAGFKVASQDMEIRGAGNLLGQQQSGNITKVGFDMYQALLQEAVAELKGKAKSDLREPELQLPVTALIPDAFIPEAADRLGFYRRLNDAETDEEAYDILQEMGDLYGHPPVEVENLVQLLRVKRRAAALSVLAIDYGPGSKTMGPRIVLRFDQGRRPDPNRLAAFVANDKDRRKLVPDGRLVLVLDPFEQMEEVLELSLGLLDQLIAAVLR